MGYVHKTKEEGHGSLKYFFKTTYVEETASVV